MCVLTSIFTGITKNVYTKNENSFSVFINDLYPVLELLPGGTEHSLDSAVGEEKTALLLKDAVDGQFQAYRLGGVSDLLPVNPLHRQGVKEPFGLRLVPSDPQPEEEVAPGVGVLNPPLDDEEEGNGLIDDELWSPPPVLLDGGAVKAECRGE